MLPRKSVTGREVLEGIRNPVEKPQQTVAQVLHIEDPAHKFWPEGLKIKNIDSSYGKEPK